MKRPGLSKREGGDGSADDHDHTGRTEHAGPRQGAGRAVDELSQSQPHPSRGGGLEGRDETSSAGPPSCLSGSCTQNPNGAKAAAATRTPLPRRLGERTP